MLMSPGWINRTPGLEPPARQKQTPAGAGEGAGGCLEKRCVSPGSRRGRAGLTRRGSRRRPVRACRREHGRGGGRRAARLRREEQRVHMLARRSGHSGRWRSELVLVEKRFRSRLPPTFRRPQSFRPVTRTHRSCLCLLYRDSSLSRSRERSQTWNVLKSQPVRYERRAPKTMSSQAGTALRRLPDFAAGRVGRSAAGAPGSAASADASAAGSAWSPADAEGSKCW